MIATAAIAEGANYSFDHHEYKTAFRSCTALQPAAKTGTLTEVHSGLYIPDPRGSKRLEQMTD